MKKLFYLFLLAAILVLLSRFRYATYAPGEGPYAAQVAPNTATRVDRLTGDIDAQESSGTWRTIGNTRSALAFEQPVDPSAAAAPPSARDNRRLRDQKRYSVETTQDAVEAATAAGH